MRGNKRREPSQPVPFCRERHFARKRLRRIFDVNFKSINDPAERRCSNEAYNLAPNDGAENTTD